MDGPISNKALCFVWWQKINEQTGLTFPAGRTLIWKPSEDPHCPVYPENNGRQRGNMYAVYTHMCTVAARTPQRANSVFHKLLYVLLITSSPSRDQKRFSFFCLYVFYLANFLAPADRICWNQSKVNGDLNYFFWKSNAFSSHLLSWPTVRVETSNRTFFFFFFFPEGGGI